MLATDLQSLLLDLNGVSDVQAEELGRAEFRRLYVPGAFRGTLRAYDDSEVVFFEDRFDHAFFTTVDRYRRPYAKNVLDRARVARVRWIGPILRGEVANTQCWETCRGTGDTRTQRLCIASAELYVVWLDERRNGGWRFSTAYVPRAAQASDYTYGKKVIWKV
jgi:hypothetical protein